METLKSLPQPRAVATVKTEAHEVLSVWLVDRTQLAATFLPGMNDNAVAKWGPLLTDVAHFLAHAHAEKHGGTADQALELVRQSFNAECSRGAQPGGISLKRD